MNNKTVSEKALERAKELALEKSNEKVGSGIIGLEGLESDDVNMPYVYLVRSNSKHAVKADGTKAKPGSYFHNVKKVEYKDLEVLIVHAQKGTTAKSDEDTTPVPVWRALCIQTTNLVSPFVVSFKGMNNWYGWKPFVSLLMSEGVKDIKSKVYRMSFKMASTADGREYEVPVIEILRDATEKELEFANSIATRFSGVVNEETIDEKLNDDVQDIFNQMEE